MDEFSFINSLKQFQNLSSQVIIGIGDDTAVLRLDAKRYQLFTTDMCVDGQHFLVRTPAYQVGWKAMAVNVSDIAAMGGTPTCAVVSLGFPTQEASSVMSKSRRLAYIKRVYSGLQACAEMFGISIVGGDTVSANRLTINVALLGEVKKKDLVTRAGARVGDGIYVTGPLGGSLASGHHLSFTPRVKEAQWLVKHLKPTAMMDISDGLAGDVRHILRASSCGAVLDAARIPCNQGVSIAQAMTDGEDFELLFTLPAAKERYCPFVRVGRIVKDHGLFCVDINGRQRKVTVQGFSHF